MTQVRILVFSPSSASFPLCRARYTGNTACDHEVSKRFPLPCPSSHSSLSIPACGPRDSNPKSSTWSPQWDSLGTIGPGTSGKSDFTGSCLAAMPALPWACQPGEAFHPLWHHCAAEPLPPPPPPLPSLLARCHPNSLGSFRGFYPLVGNFIWPFQVGQEQVLDLLMTECFYLGSAKEVQWKDCSCWAKTPHLLQSSYAFTSGTAVKTLLTLGDVLLLP